MRLTPLLLLTALHLVACSSLDDPSADDRLADEVAAECVRSHPRDEDEALGDEDNDLDFAESDVVGECTNDSGDCQASIPCEGTAEDRECDSALFLGADASTCIAEAKGEERGLQGLEPHLVYDQSHRRVVWQVRNVLRESPDGSSDGQIFVIDAVTGEVLAMLGWRATP